MPKSKWKEFADKGLKVLSEAADVAVHLKTNPGPVGLIAVGARVFNTINEVTTGEASDFFKGWKHVRGVYPLGDFTHALCKSGQLLVDEKHGNDAGSGPKVDGKVVTANLGGIRIGWTEYDNWNDGPYAAPGQDMGATVEAIRELIWVTMGNAAKFHQPALGAPVLLDDSIDGTLPSRTADEIWDKQRKFIEKGYHRALLIYGEPGTGKSHIIRRITDQAGGRRLRIRARDLEHLRSLGSLIDFLQPSGVMIDDLDRAKDKEGVIEEFDEIKAKAKLFLVTVNVVKKLDPAVVRRFNDDYLIEKLDDAVYDRLLKGIDKEIADRLRELPVTYIDMYREAHDALGDEGAKDELDRLIARRKLVQEMMEAAEEGKGEKTPSENPPTESRKEEPVA